MSDLGTELPFVAADAVGSSEPPPALLTDPLSVAKQPQRIVRQPGYGALDGEEPPEGVEGVELAVLSQEPGESSSDAFLYDAVAGAGITVYILGSGLNLETPVCLIHICQPPSTLH